MKNLILILPLAEGVARIELPGKQLSAVSCELLGEWVELILRRVKSQVTENALSGDDIIEALAGVLAVADSAAPATGVGDFMKKERDRARDVLSRLTTLRSQGYTSAKLGRT